MAPALTKILKDGHGIHLSSPLGSIILDSAELDSPLRSADALQKMWLNVSSIESGLAASPLDVPSDPSLSSCLEATSSQCEALFLPSPASLLGMLSSSVGLRDSHQVASVFPGVPDMFLAPLPEHNSQEAPLLSSAPECGPGGGDVLHSPSLTLSIVPPPPPPSCSHGEIKCQGYAFAFPPPLTVSQMGFSEEPGGELLPSSFVLEEAVKQQLSRQAGLHSRAQTLQRRLQALLGEHAVRHCNQQLEGLNRLLGCAPTDGYDRQLSWLGSSTVSSLSSLTELTEFSRCSQVVLQGLQEALDSEATASSSSDEELEETTSHRKTKAAALSSSSSGGGASSCERRWLEERAELGSRWSWLQLRLAELEGRIQQQVELHKHMRSMKRGVVLAESQPLTDRQIQQTLLREMAGLSCTASDADAEPCSPTRLLHNIERQSAQLSQIVNSLMPPLSFSPLSKQPHTWKGDRAFKSAFAPQKRRRLSTRRLFKADVSCVCARTRPLVTYHKPRLFTLGTRGPRSLQDSGTSTLPSSLSPCSCPCCSSCDPVVLCSNADCSSGRAQASRAHGSTPHPMCSLSDDVPLSLHLKRSREEWSLRPLAASVRPAGPAAYDRRSSTPLHDGHKYKQHARHPKSGVMGLSPIRTASSAPGRHGRSGQRKRKRRHLHRLVGDDDEEDEEEDLYRLCDTEDSSEEVLVESYAHVTHKQTSQGFVRKRQGESVYNINNIVIPMPVTKVEKLQYKDILTPSWRAVGSLNREAQTEEDSEEGQEEDLADEVFAQRHLAFEQREKLRWGCWGQKTGLRHPKRSGSRSSGSGGGMCTSGEESSVELSCAQLETDEQQSSEEWLPQTPWEPRAFPLDQDDEAALLSDGLEEAPAGWSPCAATSTTPRNYSSHVSSAQSSEATLPPAGHSRSRTPDLS